MLTRSAASVLDPTLRRFDIFLDRGKGDMVARNRLLGLLDEHQTYQDSDASPLFEGIDIRKPDMDRLQPIVKRFFHHPDATVQKITLYCDESEPEGKWNVKRLQVDVGGQAKHCYLKYMDEGKRRECLAMRLNNILTDAPIPFIAGGYVCLQLGISGPTFDHLPQSFSTAKAREYNFSLGKAEEFCRLIRLADRRGPNIVYMDSVKVQNIDFGAAFARYDSLRRFVDPQHAEAFDEGREAGKAVIRARFAQHAPLVGALLSCINDDVIAAMKAENSRDDFDILDPRQVVGTYLQSIGLALS